MHAFASELANAHRQPLAKPASAPPTDFATAMNVQREVAQALGASVAGWKVGFSADGTSVAGPLYASVVQASGASRRLPERGFIVEIEIAFRLARDLPPRDYTRAQILDAVAEAVVGIELIHGRFGEPPGCPFPAFLADNLGNDGYVTGDATREFRALDLKALRCRFEVDGQVVQHDVGGHPQGDPVEPLRAYASKPIDALGGLRAGQVITTGSLTKPLRVERPASIAAELEGIGRVAVTLAR